MIVVFVLDVVEKECCWWYCPTDSHLSLSREKKSRKMQKKKNELVHYCVVVAALSERKRCWKTSEYSMRSVIEGDSVVVGCVVEKIAVDFWS